MAKVNDMEHPTTPGTVLRLWRERIGIRQAELARRLGVSAPSVSDWESDKKSPRIQHAIAIDTLSGGEVPMSVWTLKPKKAA